MASYSIYEGQTGSPEEMGLGICSRRRIGTWRFGFANMLLSSGTINDLRLSRALDTSWKYVVIIIHILWSWTRMRFPDVVGVEIRIPGWSLSESFP
jgi:hypothetical protein